MGANCGRNGHPVGLPEAVKGNPQPDSLPDRPLAPLRSAPQGSTGSRSGDPSQRGRASRRESTGFRRALFINHAEGTLETIYNLGAKAGEGTQGVVFVAERKGDGANRAVKRVAKAHMRGPDVKKFKEEVEILKSMDHPNIVKLYDTFEDTSNYYLVMELCKGGELLDKIISQGHLTEAQAAVVVQEVLRAVFYLHENDIVHRDLKPENFLLADDGAITEDNVLKLIDFGIATHCPAGQMLTELCGTPFYVAPQVVTRRYDKRCDLWSVGVIMYTSLTGTVPFNGSDAEILQKVRVGIVQYPGQVWSAVSEDAKRLVKAFLTRNADARISAGDALNDKWIKEMAPKAKEAHMSCDVIRRLNSFRYKNVVKQACLQIIAGEMSHELDPLRQMFTSLDKNGDGTLTLGELKAGLERSGCVLPSDVDAILQGVDSDGSGAVDYTEFLAATLDGRKHLNTEVLRTAFKKFDKNGDGRIAAKEIVSALGGGNSRIGRAYEKLAKQVVDEFGLPSADGSNEMDFEAFLRMMVGPRDPPSGCACSEACRSALPDAEGKAPRGCCMQAATAAHTSNG